MKVIFTLIFVLNILPFSNIKAQENSKTSLVVAKEQGITYESMFNDLSWTMDLEQVNDRLKIISNALTSSSFKEEQNEELVSFKLKMLNFKIRWIERILSDRENKLKDPSAEKMRMDNLETQKNTAQEEFNSIRQNYKISNKTTNSSSE